MIGGPTKIPEDKSGDFGACRVSFYEVCRNSGFRTYRRDDGDKKSFSYEFYGIGSRRGFRVRTAGNQWHMGDKNYYAAIFFPSQVLEVYSSAQTRFAELLKRHESDDSFDKALRNIAEYFKTQLSKVITTTFLGNSWDNNSSLETDEKSSLYVEIANGCSPERLGVCLGHLQKRAPKALKRTKKKVDKLLGFMEEMIIKGNELVEAR